jgi:hypothetical protein
MYAAGRTYALWLRSSPPPPVVYLRTVFGAPIYTPIEQKCTRGVRTIAQRLLACAAVAALA